MSVSTLIDFTAKIIAALASAAPLYLTWEALLSNPSLTPKQKQVLHTPGLLAVLAFGTGYASCSDARAVVAAGLIAVFFFDHWV